MLKKSLQFCLLSSALLAATAFSHGFAALAMSAPSVQQDKATQEAAPVTAQSVMQLDRSGVDRASVHLQILQQTNTHFAETLPPKKTSANDKKVQVKASSNS